MSYRIGILTLSDKGARGERVDGSGPLLTTLVVNLGQVVKSAMISDDVATIAETLCAWADEEHLHLILTTGGTGLSPRDVTPEATLRVTDRLVPGMAEAMRSASLSKTPHAMLSRAVVGIRGTTLIINLPGSPRGASENLSVLLPALGHALAKLQGDSADCATPL